MGSLRGRIDYAELGTRSEAEAVHRAGWRMEESLSQSAKLRRTLKKTSLASKWTLEA